MNEYSNEIAFLVIAYELVSGKELWMSRITNTIDLIEDINQVVIDESASSIYLSVILQSANINIV